MNTNPFALKQHWLKRLYQEIDTLYWQRRVNISKPSLDVSQLSNVWGDYDSLTQQIRLSETLISTQHWSTTVGVLAHELAHHLAWYLGFEGTDHGKGFQQACDILGVPAVFRRATGDLPAVAINSEPEPQHVDLLRRVEKLLALAGSCNEHEASLAMRRAHDLMLRYNIDHPNPQNFKESIIRLGKAKSSPLTSAISSLLVAHYRVQVVHSTEYEANTNRELRTLHVLGEAHFVDMAEYVFHYLLRTTDNLWFEYKIKTNAAGILKNSFQLGVINGFSKKMDEASRERKTTWSSSDYAIVVSEAPGFQEFLNNRFPRLRNKLSGGRHIDNDVYNHGHSQGRSLNVSKGVTQKSGEGRLFLPS